MLPSYGIDRQADGGNYIKNLNENWFHSNCENGKQRKAEDCIIWSCLKYLCSLSYTLKPVSAVAPHEDELIVKVPTGKVPELVHL